MISIIVRMGILRKREDLTTEAFRKHWLEVHGPIAAKIPGLRRYFQHHVIDSEQRGIDYNRSNLVIDGFSELWFEDMSTTQQSSLTPDNIKMLAEDEARFIGDLKLIVAKKTVVIPTACDKRLIKRMSTIKRLPDIDFEAFKRGWEDHAEILLSMPGIEGYAQNLVLDRTIQRGKSAAYEELPIDGVVELWFENTETLNAAFASPVGQKAMAQAKTFLGEITAFLVEPYAIV